MEMEEKKCNTCAHYISCEGLQYCGWKYYVEDNETTHDAISNEEFLRSEWEESKWEAREEE